VGRGRRRLTDFQGLYEGDIYYSSSFQTNALAPTIAAFPAFNSEGALIFSLLKLHDIFFEVFFKRIKYDNRLFK